MFKKIFALILIISFQIQVFANGGMWLPQLLKMLNEDEMQSLGMKMTAEDVYSINHGSLKDAIVHFGGFCTSELISDKGLLLTNHHCGYGEIQGHSTIENNYLKNGFWAKTEQDELACTGLTATFIDRIDDVTEAALMGVVEGLSVKERQSLIDKNIERIRANVNLAKYQKLIIRPFYNGNQYFSFITTIYNDVRLVGAPPESIGKFGSDTDNWVWPRHTGDFSMFRIYAGKDNLPADFSMENKPFVPKHFLPVSLDGVEEDDFTLIFGFPGRTNQYLPAVAVEQVINTLNPAKIEIRDKALKIMNDYMRKDEATRLQYSSKYAQIANYWKKWIGERTGLMKTDAVGKKRQKESLFLEEANKQNKEMYKNILTEFEKVYDENEHYGLVKDYYNEIVNRNVELLSAGSLMKRLVNTYKSSGDEGYINFKGRLINYLEGKYKNNNPEIDKAVFVELTKMYIANLDGKYVPNALKKEHLFQFGLKSIEEYADYIYFNTFLTDFDQLKAVLNKEPKEAVSIIENDALYKLTEEWSIIYQENVAIHYNKNRATIDSLQRIYMKGQLELFPNKKLYPDANSTLRVSYGQVKGYSPRDAVSYNPVTYLSGVIEKYVPGDYEFDVRPKLLELYEQKDYGQYADKSGDIPICFLGTNHTTGGNSGSPTIDAHGNLIGLNFDRVWEGTMSDMNFDASICRNIMVDIRYILFIVDKYAGATRLIEEMKLVHPKK